VGADRRLGRALGIAGTPAFFVNGRRATSSRIDEELPRLIEHVLSLLSAGGVAPPLDERSGNR
jgi:protein-disulfide isomerase